MTKYIHEVDLEDQSLNQFNFGENADQRTESSGLDWHLFPEFESIMLFTVEQDMSTPPVNSVLSIILQPFDYLPINQRTVLQFKAVL